MFILVRIIILVLLSRGIYKNIKGNDRGTFADLKLIGMIVWLGYLALCTLIGQ
jgi:hypothetical protein